MATGCVKTGTLIDPLEAKVRSLEEPLHLLHGKSPFVMHFDQLVDRVPRRLLTKLVLTFLNQASMLFVQLQPSHLCTLFRARVALAG